MNVQTNTYVLLYSLYSYPNVILCFFGGFLLDRVFGVRWVKIICSKNAILFLRSRPVWSLTIFLRTETENLKIYQKNNPCINQDISKNVDLSVVLSLMQP